MATISNAQAVVGLTANATPVGANLSGTTLVGKAVQVYAITAADTAYSVRITAATTSNVAVLTPSTGTCTGTTGTPVILNGSGRDCEGVTIPTMSGLKSVLFMANSANTGDVTITTQDGSAALKYGEMRGIFSTTMTYISPAAAMTFSFSKGGDILDVTVVGA